MIATYRIQLSADFDFDAAAAIVPYLSRLGISHVYASPYLQAVRGSTHGYDVVDHGRVNEELGGERGREWFCRSLAEAGMSHILDVVPNHMAITGPESVWWWDVLENGMSSRFAHFFDVDWEYGGGSSNRILLPVLGDHCGRLIEAGEIRLERSGGSFRLRYYEHVAPVSPRSLAGILETAADHAESDDLAFIAGAMARLPASTDTDRHSIARRHRDKEVLRRTLAELLDEQPNIRRAVDDEVERVNGDPELLDSLHEAQNYRLALWRLARSDLGYRRFFDINTLVGLRMEDEEVFSETHHLVLQWLADGSLSGLRVDHPDGLLDPREYFERLRRAAPRAWIVAEKILEPDEHLPPDWPVDGTTGYDLLNEVNRLFVSRAGEQPLTELYQAFTGERRSYAAILHGAKHLVMTELFASDVYRLIDLFGQIAARHRRYRDFSGDAIATALTEVLAAMPVYRTYAVAATGEISDTDRGIVTEAIGAARERLPEIDEELLEFIGRVLMLEVRGDLESEFVMRFQQLSGPVMAKGAEDTVFYVYNRFVGLNEVGGDPRRFGTSSQAFHRFMEHRVAHHPRAMSAASTHDTKRSEDTRARLAVLSTIPDRWKRFVTELAERTASYRSTDTPGTRLPDANLEYALYQNLVATWPIGFDRIWAYAQKAMREAKTHTRWTSQNAEYEAGVQRFLEALLGDEAITDVIDAFVEEIRIAGWMNSLAATVVRLTAPGVPDTYQGCELWDHSLVDPDNRRPVDYEARMALLDRLQEIEPAEAFAEWESGLPKLHVMRTCLALRAEREASFAGGYTPVAISGDHGESFVAYLRGDDVLVAVRRIQPVGDIDPASPSAEATLELPTGRWTDRLTGRRYGDATRTLSLPALLDRAPAAVLVKGEVP